MCMGRKLITNVKLKWGHQYNVYGKEMWQEKLKLRNKWTEVMSPVQCVWEEISELKWCHQYNVCEDERCQGMWTEVRSPVQWVWKKNDKSFNWSDVTSTTCMGRKVNWSDFTSAMRNVNGNLRKATNTTAYMKRLWVVGDMYWRGVTSAKCMRFDTCRQHCWTIH